MREIKFRLWIGKRWVYWGFIPDIHGFGLEFRGLPQSNVESLSIEEMRERSQQYTGLRDKHGKEIYEGDRLDGIMGDGYIGYCEKCKSFEYFGDDFGCYACSGDFYWSEAVDLTREVEVIGNIYEDPNLRNGSVSG